jgi:hypothetical protein
MATVSSLVTDILSDIPEIPRFAAERQYVRALRILCEKARVWRVENTLTIPTTADTSLSALLPANTEMVDVISIKPIDGSTPVRPKTQSWLDINETDWRDQTALTARWYVLSTNNIIQFVPSPSESVDYYFRIAVKPTPDLALTEVADVVANKYSELLVHGAKSFLFMTPRKPWTDLQLAQYHEAVFQTGIPDARSEAADEFQTGVARKVKYGGL